MNDKGIRLMNCFNHKTKNIDFINLLEKDKEELIANVILLQAEVEMLKEEIDSMNEWCIAKESDD